MFNPKYKEEIKNYILNSQSRINLWEYHWFNQDEFKQEVMSNWAAKEILKEVEANPDVSPIIIVEQFAERMDNYSLENTFVSFSFSVAKDTADDILSILWNIK